MVPLFKSVGYQLICHTFTEKCELSNSNLELCPSMFFLGASWNRKKAFHFFTKK